MGVEQDLGITGLVKGGKGGKNVGDFELVDGGWEEGERLNGWKELPVGLTMNLVSFIFLLWKELGSGDGEMGVASPVTRVLHLSKVRAFSCEVSNLLPHR